MRVAELGNHKTVDIVLGGLAQGCGIDHLQPAYTSENINGDAIVAVDVLDDVDVVAINLMPAVDGDFGGQGWQWERRGVEHFIQQGVLATTCDIEKGDRDDVGGAGVGDKALVPTAFFQDENGIFDAIGAFFVEPNSHIGSQSTECAPCDIVGKGLNDSVWLTDDARGSIGQAATGDQRHRVLAWLGEPPECLGVDPGVGALFNDAHRHCSRRIAWGRIVRDVWWDNQPACWQFQFG